MTMLQRTLRLLAAAAALALGGCATTLQGVLIQGEARARSGEVTEVQVLRGASRVRTETGMALQPGDRVVTGPNAFAVIQFAAGTEVYMRPDSSVRIGSLREVVGEVFAKIRGAFSIETEFVRAGAEGTAFLTRAPPGADTTVVVFDGRVVCESVRGAWSPVRLARGERLDAVHGAAPRVGRASADELRETERWVERIERAVSRGPTTGQVVGGLAVAGLVAAILASRDRDDDRREPGPSPRPLPGVPARTAPGGSDAARPQPLGGCRQVVLDWAAVPEARDYDVSLERAPGQRTRSWTRLQVPVVTETRVDVTRLLEPGATYRWTVQARNAQGQTGPPAPARYFGCEYPLR